MQSSCLIRGRRADSSSAACLQWTTAGDGPRLGAFVHHTDAEREWAYDRDSQVGALSRGLDEAPKLGWLLIDMKSDWTKIFP